MQTQSALGFITKVKPYIGLLKGRQMPVRVGRQVGSGSEWVSGVSSGG